MQIVNENQKIKGIADALILMMEKVDGIKGNVKDAWKWTKKVVW
jgi:hypothetical protein